MKTIKNISSFLILILLLISVNSCSEKNSNTKMDNENTKQVFTTPEEAALKGKNDILLLLKNNKDINLNIDPSKFENSMPGNLIKQNEIDFNKILNTDSVKSLSEITGEEKYTIAPFVSDNIITGVVEINKDSEGWKVSGLGNRSSAADINEISKTLGIDAGKMNITAYEVPNIQISIYEVSDTSGTLYYMNEKGNINKEEISIQNLYSVLKEKAVIFQREFGELVKGKKLLK